jgi:small subunit ribosomal protein S20
MVNKARTAIESGDKAAMKEEINKAIVALDKAAQKGVIHKNNAARRKSRLMKYLASVA